MRLPSFRTILVCSERSTWSYNVVMMNSTENIRYLPRAQTATSEEMDSSSVSFHLSLLFMIRSSIGKPLFEPLSVHGWTSTFLLAVHRLCGAIEGRLSQFFAMLTEAGLAECDQPGKSRLKYSAMAGNWTRATGRTDSEIHSFCHGAIMTRPWGGMTVRFIYFPTELSWLTSPLAKSNPNARETLSLWSACSRRLVC